MTTKSNYIDIKHLILPAVFTLMSVVAVVICTSMLIGSTRLVNTDCLTNIPREIWWEAKCTSINSTLVSMEIIDCEVLSVVSCVTDNTFPPGSVKNCWYAAADAKCADAGKTITMNPVYDKPEYITIYNNYVQCVGDIQLYRGTVHSLASVTLGIGLVLPVLSLVMLGYAGTTIETFDV